MPLNVVEVPQFSATVPVGDVISQSYDPPANEDGAIDVNATVTIFVSLGPSAAAVPDIESLEITDATALIALNGLTNGVITYVVVESGFYIVSDQSPAAGSSATVGDPVDFTVTVPSAVEDSPRGRGRRH